MATSYLVAQQRSYVQSLDLKSLHAFERMAHSHADPDSCITRACIFERLQNFVLAAEEWGYASDLCTSIIDRAETLFCCANMREAIENFPAAADNYNQALEIFENEGDQIQAILSRIRLIRCLTKGANRNQGEIIDSLKQCRKYSRTADPNVREMVIVQVRRLSQDAYLAGRPDIESEAFISSRRISEELILHRLVHTRILCGEWLRAFMALTMSQIWGRTTNYGQSWMRPLIGAVVITSVLVPYYLSGHPVHDVNGVAPATIGDGYRLSASILLGADNSPFNVFSEWGEVVALIHRLSGLSIFALIFAVVVAKITHHR